MLFAGLQRRRGRVLPVRGDRSSASLANLVGSWIAYAVGYYGRVDILEKHGRSCTSSRRTCEWADRWFERYGDATVFFTRMLPIIRTFISLPAGVARMPFWRFSVFTVARLPAVGLHAHVHRQAGRATTGRTGRTACTTSTTRSPR